MNENGYSIVEPFSFSIVVKMEDRYDSLPPYQREFRLLSRRSFGASFDETRSISLMAMKEVLANAEREIKAEIERRFYLAQGIDLDLIDSVLNGEHNNTKQERDSL